MDPLTPINKVLDFISDIIKPPIKELSEILTDQVRLWRFKNQVRLLEKAQSYVKVRGFKPTKLPLKILVPLLENASLEEDEELHDMWAKLLVNAVDPASGSTNHIIFVEILKQLSPTEAQLLLYFQSEAKKVAVTNFRSYFIDFEKCIKDLNLTNTKDALLFFENLMRLRLIEPRAPIASRPGLLNSYALIAEHSRFRLTNLGAELLRMTS